MWGVSEHTLPALGLALIEEIPKRFGDHSQQFISVGDAMKAELEELMGENGVMLLPTHPLIAPKHNEPLRKPFNFALTAIINALELCGTQVSVYKCVCGNELFMVLNPPIGSYGHVQGRSSPGIPGNLPLAS